MCVCVLDGDVLLDFINRKTSFSFYKGYITGKHYNGDCSILLFGS